MASLDLMEGSRHNLALREKKDSWIGSMSERKKKRIVKVSSSRKDDKTRNVHKNKRRYGMFASWNENKVEHKDITHCEKQKRQEIS
jgi:hypothetical protein